MINEYERQNRHALPMKKISHTPTPDAPLAARLSLPLTISPKREVMVMPAGEHECTFGQGGRDVVRRVRVEPGAALALQSQLEAVAARSALEPYFDFNHTDDTASGHPKRFFWKDGERPGVYAETNWSGSGAKAIAGKDYQAFSMVFYVDQQDPAQVICNPGAKLNFGGLVNDPAFKAIAPLWAKAEPNHHTTTTQHDTDTMNDTKDAEITSLKARLEAADGAMRAQRAKDARGAVAAAVQRGALPPKDEPLQAKWQKWCEDTPEMIEALAAIEGSPVLSDSITRSSSFSSSSSISSLQAKEGPKRVLQAYGALVARNSAIRPDGAIAFEQKGQIAREMAALYAREIRGNFKDYADMPLLAADFTDPAGNLGTLSG
jgi:hypothetical protein